MDDIERRANALAVRVTAEAERAMSTPGRAGYVPEYRGGHRSVAPSMKAAYLRGVAKKIVGPEWGWTVMEFSGGEAAFVITEHRPERAA